jgi:hypothetical protein
MAIDDYSNKVKERGEKERMNITFFKDVESAKKWFRNMNG